MARSEFRWNKKRKHYSYLFKDKKEYRKNLLLHSDPSKRDGWTKNRQKEFNKSHTKLFRHPNPNKSIENNYYVENRIYTDHRDSFETRTYKWKWDKNDKRKIKRLKKGRRTR